MLVVVDKPELRESALELSTFISGLMNAIGDSLGLPVVVVDFVVTLVDKKDKVDDRNLVSGLLIRNFFNKSKVGIE